MPCTIGQERPHVGRRGFHRAGEPVAGVHVHGPDPLRNDGWEERHRVAGMRHDPVLKLGVEVGVERAQAFGRRADLMVAVHQNELRRRPMINDPGKVMIDEGAHALLGLDSTPQPSQRHIVVRREALDIEGVGQMLLTAEVVIQAADTCSGTLENLIDGGIHHTLFEEQRQSSVEQSLSFPFRARCHEESFM